MRSMIQKAVMKEVGIELDKRLDTVDAPSTQRVKGDALELGYLENAYRVNVQVDHHAKARGSVTRLPHYRLIECHHELSDPNLFSEIGEAVARRIRKDRLLVRVLEKLGQPLLAALRDAVVEPAGWSVLYFGPALHKNAINVSVSFQPAVAQFALPAVSFRMVLAAYRSGRFKVSLSTDSSRLETVRSMVAWEIDTPASIAGKQFVTADLPHVATITVNHLQDFVEERISQLLPIQSVNVLPKVRQAMLVLVPLRVARDARQTGEVPWHRDLTAACLNGLAGEEESATNLVRRLLFQLMRVELTEGEERERAFDDYQRLGLELAGRRRLDDSLPYNPALAYVRHDQANLEAKLTDEDRRDYAWFLEHATLEELADFMGLV